ncbi:MAG: hypothetical protein JOZ96_11400 [Acidobacteria bacterium]|nr:hypothetical protein [Acidobacteriota bacterium]
MYVKFEYTEDDLVNACERFLSRSKTVRSARVKGVVYSVVTMAIIIGCAAVGVGYGAAVVGAAAGLFVLAYQQLNYRDSLRGRLRKHIREQHGQFGTDVCEVELTPVGVCVRQCRMQVTYEWEVVEEMTASADSVDIYTRHGGGVIVRARAFEDAGEMSRFMDTAAGYIELSRASAAPDDGIAEGRRVGGVLKHG